MTENEIQKLFVEHPFGEAKKILIEDIEKSGRELTGNENVFELRAIALECSRYSTSVNNEQTNSESSGHMEGGSVSSSPKTGEESRASGEGESQEGEAQSEQEAANAPQNANGEQTGETQQKETPKAQAQAVPPPVTINAPPPEQQSFINELISEIEKEGGGKGRRKKKENQSKTQGKKEEETSQETGEGKGEKEETNSKNEAKENEKQSGNGQEENSGETKEEDPQPKEKSEKELEDEASELMKEAQKKIEEANKMREERKRKEEEERRKREREQQNANRHFMTDEVVKRLKTLHKAFLVGPAGTGKSTLAMCACRELFGIEGTLEDVVKSGKFAQISFSPDTVSADMLGFTDVNGVFHETEIIRVFRDGGLILFDEMDDADASLLVKLNTMLANRVIPIPGKMVVQNPNTYIVGTANTYGKGGNSMYVGRSRLDGATLDRWKMATIRVDYDRNLEASIIGRNLWKTNKKICTEIRVASDVIRSLIVANKWKQICSTRFVIDAVEMAKNGYTWVEILNTFLLDWDELSAKKVRDMFAEKMKITTSPIDFSRYAG